MMMCVASIAAVGAAAGLVAAVISRNSGPLIIVPFASALGWILWFLRRQMGVEIDDTTGALILHTGARGGPERIECDGAVLRVPRPAIVFFSFAGAPAVEVRSVQGRFRPCPLMYQGQIVRSVRLRRFADECEARGINVIRE